MRWMKQAVPAAIVLAGLAAAPTGAEASLVLTPSGFPAPTQVVTFNQYGGLGYNYTAGPVDVGGLVGEAITLKVANPQNTNSGQGAVLGQGTYGLGGNGSWGQNGQIYFAVDGGSVVATFTFATAVSAVGGFVNYAPGFGTPFLTALGAGDVVLETYNLSVAAPISTPNGANAGAFRGIQRASDDIVAFRLTGGFLVMDDMTFGRATVAPAVPEPSTVASLALAGLLGLAARARRRILALA